MASISARKACQVLDNLESILAVELLSAAQAFDYRRPMKSGHVLEACHDLVRERIDHAEEDRIFGEDIATARNIIANKELVVVSNRVADRENVNLNGAYDGQFRIY